MNWLENITIDDLPIAYREMAELIGIECTIKLAIYYCKQGFYFRNLDELIADKKTQFILKNFTGNNHAELSRATGWSVRYIYDKLKEVRDDRQKELFAS